MPIFRKGTHIDPTNYCPVSLTSIICKVAEHIICSGVCDHLHQHQILSANHGFCQGHSCKTQLLLTTHDLLKHHDHRHQVDVGILDFSKAFDSVPHRSLISKLRLYGIEGGILHWIFYSMAAFFPAVHIYINDLPSVVDPNTSVSLFADDVLVYRVINTIQDFARLERWAKALGMVFSASKYYVKHIHHGTPPSRISTRYVGLLKSCHQREIPRGTHHTGPKLVTSHSPSDDMQRPHRSLDLSAAIWKEPQHNASNSSTWHWDRCHGWETVGAPLTPVGAERKKKNNFWTQAKVNIQVFKILLR